MTLLQRILAHTALGLSGEVCIAEAKQLVIFLQDLLPLLGGAVQPIYRGGKRFEAPAHIAELRGARLMPLVRSSQLLEQLVILIFQRIVEQGLGFIPDHLIGQGGAQAQHRYAPVLPKNKGTAAFQLLHSGVLLYAAVSGPVELLAGAVGAVFTQREAEILHRPVEAFGDLCIALREKRTGGVIQ